MNDAMLVCAVYNQRPDWLLEAINSVRDIPLILADDGSTDNGTKRVLGHFKALGIPVIECPHRGMEPTLNDAIAMADAEFVGILDSDDRRIAGSLEQQAAFLALTPEAVAVHGRFNYIDATGRVLRENMLHPTPCHSTLVFRKSAWAKVGGYPTGFTFGEGDSYFIERLRTIGDVSALPTLCADRRVHPDSLSFNNQPRLQRILREGQA